MTSGVERINEGLLRHRLEKALKLRQQTFPGQQSYRWIFSEADGMPSLIIDRFGDTVVFQTLSAGMDKYKDFLIASIKDLVHPRSIIERNDVSVREKEGLPLLKQVAWGENPREVQIEFAGKQFNFDPLEGQKTGFFLDQRHNALEAGRFLRGSVLDAFCYVGQFGMHTQAETTLFVDASENALSFAKQNAELNGLKNIDFKMANVFDFLKECDQQKRRFDGISLDPPAFVKTRAALKGALAGYKEINLRALRLLNPGGILVTSSCSQNLSRDDFEKMLSISARDAKRHIQVLTKLGQPADHPTLLSMPESEYLKCYVLRVE